MIIVTGATGHLGRSIIDRLLAVVPAGEIAAVTRDPARARDLEARGVRVRQADFEVPATLTGAFLGAEQVLIISGPADPAPHLAAIEAARTAGAARILYTSHQGAAVQSQFSATAAHARTELDLQGSGVMFTALRNGFYATSALEFLRPALATGQIVLPEDGPVSWTAHRDLAAAAVVALTEPDRLSGITPPLTGAEALDFSGIARIASELTGREITRVTVADDEWRESMLARGLPEASVSLLLEIFAASRSGEFNVVDPALAQILGREPVPFRDVLATALASSPSQRVSAP
jgi:NAD(P)H dehydrogenase (quinone)